MEAHQPQPWVQAQAEHPTRIAGLGSFDIVVRSKAVALLKLCPVDDWVSDRWLGGPDALAVAVVVASTADPFQTLVCKERYLPAEAVQPVGQARFRIVKEPPNGGVQKFWILRQQAIFEIAWVEYIICFGRRCEHLSRPAMVLHTVTKLCALVPERTVAWAAQRPVYGIADARSHWLQMTCSVDLHHVDR